MGGTVGLVVAAIAELGIGGFIVGYGALSLINGTATLLGLGEPVEIRVVSDGYSRTAADVTGEYVRDGETHRIGLETGIEGEVVDAQFAPIGWFDFDEPVVSWWGPLVRIVAGIFCVGIIAGPILWSMWRARRNVPQPEAPPAA